MGEERRLLRHWMSTLRRVISPSKMTTPEASLEGCCTIPFSDLGIDWARKDVNMTFSSKHSNNCDVSSKCSKNMVGAMAYGSMPESDTCYGTWSDCEELFNQASAIWITNQNGSPVSTSCSRQEDGHWKCTGLLVYGNCTTQECNNYGGIGF